MQANCPSCGQRLTVEDSRAPDRPFAVKCPRCQAAVRFPGKTAASAPPAATVDAPRVEPEPAIDLGRIRRELASGEDQMRQVLVGLPDAAQAEALTQPLLRLGYTVEVLDTPEEGGRLLEQGLFDVVVTTPAFTVDRGETVYQRITRLAPDARRRLFLVLVGDKFKTGDGTQAFAAQADLVVNPKDAASAEAALLNTMVERRRLYRRFTEAKKRFEAAGE